MAEVVPIETPGLGDRSYLIHDGSAALVIDPQRDTDRITSLAAFTQPLSDAIYLGTHGYGVLISTDGGDDWIRAGAGLPDAVFSLSFPSDSVLFMKAAREQGLAAPFQFILVGPSAAFFSKIFGKNLDGIVAHWNKGAEHIYGYTAQEMIGRPISVRSVRASRSTGGAFRSARRNRRPYASAYSRGSDACACRSRR